MGNILYHNKWHRYNHHTVPVSGFPDSAIDPIASEEFPFIGNFHTLLPFVSAGGNRLVPNFGTIWDPVSGVWVYQNSYGWWAYSSLTQANSSDWSRFFSVSASITRGQAGWFEGANAYTYWSQNSAFIHTTFRTTSSLSAADLWPRLVENILPPVSGIGWNVALSSITWKTNESQIDHRQKNAYAVNIGETESQETIPSRALSLTITLSDISRQPLSTNTFATLSALSGLTIGLATTGFSTGSAIQICFQVDTPLPPPQTGFHNGLIVPVTGFLTGFPVVRVLALTASSSIDTPSEINTTISNFFINTPVLNQNFTYTGTTTLSSLTFTIASKHRARTFNDIIPVARRGNNIVIPNTLFTVTSAVSGSDPIAIGPIEQTLNWDVSAAQTVFFAVTGNYPLSAVNVYNAVKGGKYTMWVALDFCAEPAMNVIFHPNTYRIFVKNIDEPSFTSYNNVISLSANTITRLDFVYDGNKMLGKATHYRVFLPTNFDTYLGGVGSILDPDPAEVDGTVEPFSHIKSAKPDIVISPFSETFTPVSARYIAGAGVEIDYFGGSTNLLRVNLKGAAWPTESALAANIQLTGFFDRVYGTLSADGNYDLPEYSGNLFATPLAVTAPDLIKQAYPNPPYKFGNVQTVEMALCLSALTINIVSGKDRDIRSISLDKNLVLPRPVTIDGVEVPYTTNNERQTQILLRRIQKNYKLEVTYERQIPLQSTPPILWVDIIDSTTSTQIGSNVTLLRTKPDNGLFFLQLSAENRPFMSATRATRGLDFSTTYSASLCSFLTTNRGLSSLQQTAGSIGSYRNFATFTVAVPLTSNRTDAPPQPIWWLGEYMPAAGYGVGLRGNRVFAGQRTNTGVDFGYVNTSYNAQSGLPFLIATRIRGSETSTSRRHDIFFNGRQVVTGTGIDLGSMRNFSMRLGTHNFNFRGTVIDNALSSLPTPGTIFDAYKRPNGSMMLYTANNRYDNAGNIMPEYGRFRILAVLIFPGELDLPRMTAIQNYLLNKYSIRRG